MFLSKQQFRFRKLNLKLLPKKNIQIYFFRKKNFKRKNFIIFIFFFF